jgi:predicted ATPase/DNA-binding SARP family transcriptional activator
MAVDVRFLGGLAVHVDDTAVSLGGPQAQTVFALLASDAGRPVTTARLLDELWDDDPPSRAIGTIQTHVATIRRGLGSERTRLETRAGGYLLWLDPDELDATRFASYAAEGRQLLERVSEAARGRLEAALAEWGGPPLVGLADRSRRLTTEAHRLHELHLGACEDLADARLRCGQHLEAVADLERVLADEPLRERALALLLRGLTAVGRQAEALQRFEQHRARVADALGADPSPQLRALHEDLLRTGGTRSVATTAVTSAGPERRDRLPVFHTRLFGRDRDLAALSDLIRRTRLVTVTGTGGVGKTRLAVELAREHGAQVAGGAHFVDLTTVRDGALVADATARALGISSVPGERGAEQALLRALGDTPVLIVLDNCEHLVDACADHVQRLLAGCPGCMVLATSREPLAIDGERRWPLSPLALPDTAETPTAPALELLLDRVAAVRPDAARSEEDRGALADICRQLDGLPLALELVAARLEYLAPVEVSDRLRQDQRTDLLHGPRRPPRHRTLERTIGWSYGLLEPAERTLLQAMSVFVGGATPDAIGAVVTNVAGREGAGATHDVGGVVDLVGSLVRRSLVTIDEEGGRSRYGLLETVREFAADRLRASGRDAAARVAHRDHYLGVLEGIPWDQRMFSFHRTAPKLASEFGNLGAAVATSLERQEADHAERIALGAPVLMIFTQRWEEYDRWCVALWGSTPRRLSFPDRLRRVRRPEHLIQAFWMEAWRATWTPDDMVAVGHLLRTGAERLAPGPVRVHTEHVAAVIESVSRLGESEAPVAGIPERAWLDEVAEAPLLQTSILGDVGLLLLLSGQVDQAREVLSSRPVTQAAPHHDLPLLTLVAAHHLAGDHEAALAALPQAIASAHPGARSLHLMWHAIVVAGTGERDRARDLLRRARHEYEQLWWRHPLEINDLLVAMGCCAVLEGRREIGARLLTAAGPSAAGFKPLTPIHLHYARLAGPPEASDHLPDLTDRAALEALADAELLRWAREGLSPLAAPDGQRATTGEATTPEATTR